MNKGTTVLVVKPEGPLSSDLPATDADVPARPAATPSSLAVAARYARQPPLGP